MEKIRIVFVHHRLVCGGAENALFDLVNLLDKEKFDITVFAQRNDGIWDEKFRNAGIRVIYDYSCRKATWNPVVKLGNIVKKLRIAEAYRKNGKNLLDICIPEGVDIIASYSMWDHVLCGFSSRAKSVKYLHGNMETNAQFRELILRDRELLPKYDRIIGVSNW